MQLGLAYRRLGDFETARRMLDRAVTLNPSSGKAWFVFGLVAEERRDWAASITAYRRALAAQPDFAEAAVNLGIALQERGELADARQAYRDALKIRPDTFGRIVQALSAAPTGELWLDLQALRQSLAA
jgi:tetratricopeptide (TPR) repeat protein